MKRMLKKLKKADVVLFGESHNRVMDHEMEIQMARDLYELRGENLTLGAEMFEADDQLVLDEFLSGLILEKDLISEAKTWKNYKTDYAPLVRFATEKGLPFIATNVPRRYASLVSREGMDALLQLKSEARRHVAPMPVEVDMQLSSYRNMLNMMNGHMGPNTDPSKMVAAQALKDATMAHFILQNCVDGGVLFHINGSYHSDDHQGIGYYLKLYDRRVDVVTITTVEQEDINSIEETNRRKADFIIVLTMDSPRSY